MRVLIVFRDKGHQLVAEISFGGKIRNPQSFALQNTEPLLHLIHPGTMDRRMVKAKPGMRGEPGLNLLALMHPEIV